jgi:Domain of unknown function (DUF4920)
MKKLILFATLVLILGSCTKKIAQTEVSESEAYEKYKTTKGDGKNFGEKFDPKGAMTYDQAYKKMGTAAKYESKVVGTVVSVCQTKGCWMSIKSEEGRDPMFVKFKDYAFFMPKDLAGKKIVMKGYVFKETTSVEMLKHFAEDEGKSQDEINAINKPIEEVKFMASGVILM